MSTFGVHTIVKYHQTRTNEGSIPNTNMSSRDHTCVFNQCSRQLYEII